MNPEFELGSKSVSTRTLGWWMITLAVAINLARISGIAAINNEVPFLSANDRSRWCAIAALTQEGRWEIDTITEILDSKGKSRIWNTIDMVKHRGEDGQEHSYSSKPPLLTLMLAAVTKPVMMAVHAVRGKNLTEDPFLIGRIVIVLTNLIPLAIWWCCLHRWLETHVPRAWTRMAILSLAIWGTFLTTFIVTINNHLHGAIFFSISLAFAWQILRSAQAGARAPWSTWLSLGIASALAVACELPALAWAAAIGAIVFIADWKRMLLGFGIGSASIAAAFLLTNYWAHGDWRPPYSHRGVGKEIASVQLELETLKQAIADKTDPEAIKNMPEQSEWISKIRQSLAGKYEKITDQARVLQARLDGVFQVLDETTGERVALKSSPQSSPSSGTSAYSIHEWDDWYDYPKSYWLPGNKKGVDLGDPDPTNYFLHLTVGHHGIFSLTPIWFWSILGAYFWLHRGPRALDRIDNTTRSESIEPNVLTGFKRWLLGEHGIAAALCAVTLACMVFYATRETVDRNYGGVTSGFRWIFWLIPGWIWLSIPAIDRFAKKPALRGLVYLALIIGVVSATIPWGNPWTHPWPYRILMWLFPDSYQ